MSERRSIRSSLVLGLALGGVLLGHTLTYRLLLPDAHARADELARSGHAYLAGANVVAVTVAIAALAVLFLGRLLRSELATTSDVLTRLTAFQIAAFTAMEVLERCASGAGFSRIVPVLLLGLPVQVLVAAVIALIARTVSSAAERFGRAAPAMEFVSAAIAVANGAGVAPVHRPVGSPPGRAPPSFLPA
jgi:uncharacterized membrane protein YjjP (DUF1212 family)